MSDIIINAINHLAKEDFIVFAGTGVLSGTGSSSWVELLKKIEEVCDGHVEKRNWDKIDYDRLPDIAQEYYDKLSSLGFEDKYTDVVKEAVRTKHTSFSGSQTQIVLTTDRIVTTNFEDSFEKAFHDLKCDARPLIQELPIFQERNFAEHKSIIYLHGKTNTDHFILKKDDYDYFYPSVSNHSSGIIALEEFVKYLFFNHTIVIIGFSFRDKYIRELLKILYHKQQRQDEELSVKYKGIIKKTETIKHYAFLSEYDPVVRKKELLLDNSNEQDIDKIIAEEVKGNEKLDAELQKMKITCLRYTEHKNWEAWFRKIRDMREAERRSKSPKSTRDYDEY